MGTAGEMNIMGKMINNKGFAVVYLAIAIIVLIAFVGLAVDIGYMYVAKGQLQNAADAAALAGAANLINNSKSADQLDARTQAVNFADKNKVAGDFPTLDPNTGNDANGDVVLGNWDPARPVDQRFLPADGSLLVNAVKVVARRTGEIGTGIGANTRVSIFFGKIFSLLPGGGAGWPSMTASAQAIALNPQPPFISIPLCLTTCNAVTKLDGTTKFFFNAAKGSPNVTWTSYLLSSSNKGDIEDFITGKTPPPDLCSLLKNPPVCLYTTQGTVNPDMCVLIDQIRQNSRTYTVNGQQIKGWKVFIPIFDSNSNTCGSGSQPPCVGDPGAQPGDSYNFVRLAVAYIVDAVAQGNCPKLSPETLKGEQGILIVGGGPAAAGVPGSSTIQCQTCDELQGEFSNLVKLVK